MSLYHVTEFCGTGQRCTAILLQVRNVLPPLVRLEDNYTRVRHLLKARLFDQGCVALSNFFCEPCANFLTCSGWCVYIYITDWPYCQIGKWNFWSLFRCDWMLRCCLLIGFLHSSCMLCAALPFFCRKLFSLSALSVCLSLPQFLCCLMSICYFAVCVKMVCVGRMFCSWMLVRYDVVNRCWKWWISYCVWHDGMVRVRVSDLQSRGRMFDCRPFHFMYWLWASCSHTWLFVTRQRNSVPARRKCCRAFGKVTRSLMSH